MKKIKGYLPVFDGFYNSGHKFQEDMVLEFINEEREEKYLPEIEFDDFYEIAEFDYKKYRIEYCKSAVETIEKELSPEFVKSIEFESLYSPREYNFSTDSINVIYSITEENRKNIIKFVKDKFTDFETYIKDKFTDRAGFMSFYTNNPFTWYDQLLTDEFEGEETQFSVILEFIMSINNDYYEINSSINEEFHMDKGYIEYMTNYEDIINCRIFDNIYELVRDYIENDLFTEEEIKQINNSSMVLEDMVPSGNYKELYNGKIAVY